MPPPDAITGGVSVHHGAGGPVVIPTGNLPPGFASPGLTLIRTSKFDKAAIYYQEKAQSAPNNAYGWFGLGAALIGAGQSAQGIDYICQGISLDSEFPVGALIEEARPGNPQGLFQLARKLAARKDGPGYQGALSLIETCMASPLTPESLYMKADALRRTCREGYEDFNNRENSAYQGMKRRASSQRVSGRFFKTLFYLAFVALLGGGIWFWQHKIASDGAEAPGLDIYREAMAAGRAGDASTQEKLCQAWLLLHAANKAQANRIFPMLIELRCSESLVNYKAAYKPKPGMPPKAGDMEAWAKTLEGRLKSLDSSGVLLNGAEDRLRKALDSSSS